MSRRDSGTSGDPEGRTLVVDNYDSFTFNLVGLLRIAGDDPVVRRNDDLDIASLRRRPPARVVISPGPGRPEDAGASMTVVAEFFERLPILGVCLGHQCLGVHLGASLTRAPSPVHGKTARISHDGHGLFVGVRANLLVTRYHSLALDASSLATSLAVTATTVEEPAVVMGIRHRELPVAGVQFHPESFLTDDGKRMIENFLRWS